LDRAHLDNSFAATRFGATKIKNQKQQSPYIAGLSTIKRLRQLPIKALAKLYQPFSTTTKLAK
jgi:hypothetical protein